MTLASGDLTVSRADLDLVLDMAAICEDPHETELAAYARLAALVGRAPEPRSSREPFPPPLERTGLTLTQQGISPCPWLQGRG